MSIYLYKKTHRKTGLKYLGKTIKDPFVYQGSGKRWINHINQHGYDVETEILRECKDIKELKRWGLYYSNLWNIVDSKDWANLKPESGDGGDTSMCENYILGIANRDLTGEKNPNWGGFSDKHRANLSKAKQGIKPPNFEQWVRAAKGKSYYNNGIEERRFFPNEIPVEWVKGRLKVKCNCGKLVDISNLKKYHKTC